MKVAACFAMTVLALLPCVGRADDRRKAPTTRPATRPAPPKLTAEQTARVRGWIEQLGDDDADVRNAAEAALKRCSPGALPFVRAALDSEDLEVAGRAERILPFLEDAIWWYLCDVRYKPMKLDLGDGVQMRFVRIPAGTFRMGSPTSEKNRSDNEIQHTVKLTQSFYMGVTEVTQAQYEAVMGNNPSHFKGARNPVESVSWDDATAFCKKLSAKTGKSIRLPTEAEWEYACRAGSTGRFSFGDSDDQLAEYAWYFGNSKSRAHPVGGKKPNGWGLCDMHGNVREWCQDWYAKDYPSTMPTDPKGATMVTRLRVLRGGFWSIGVRYSRSAFRDRSTPEAASSSNGFRVVVSASVGPD